MCVSLYSEDNPATGRPYYDELYLSNYTTIQLKDAIARLEGVGDLFVMGGTCQRTWEHAILKTARPVGPRISVQFRVAGVL